MTKTAELLTPPRNYAIVQLPDREFPGVVFQGDSLNILISSLKKIHSMINNNPSKVEEMLLDLLSDLELTLNDYIKVCLLHKGRLPFVKIDPEIKIN